MTDFEIRQIAKELTMLLCIIAGFLIRSWLIMLLWNVVATALFSAPLLTFGYAVGLNLLTGWLFRYRKPNERQD